MAKASPVSVAAALGTQGLLALLVLAELPPTEDLASPVPGTTPTTAGAGAVAGAVAGAGSVSGSAAATAATANAEEEAEIEGVRSEQGCEEVLACLAHLAIAASPKTCQGAAAHAAATKRDKGSSVSCDAAVAALSELASFFVYTILTLALIFPSSFLNAVFYFVIILVSVIKTMYDPNRSHTQPFMSFLKMISGVSAPCRRAFVCCSARACESRSLDFAHG